MAKEETINALLNVLKEPGLSKKRFKVIVKRIKMLQSMDN